MAAEEGQVIACRTVGAWTEQLERGKGANKLLAKRFTNVIFLKVDVDELMTVAKEWKVEAMPTFTFLKDGKVVDKIVGADKDGLHNTIAKLATETATSTL